MATKKNQESHVALPLAAGLVAGIAGSYFLFGQGKKSAANRKKVKGWMLKAKGEALEKVEKMKNLDETSYHKIMDDLAAKYAKVKDVDPAEVEALVTDLKKHWKAMVRDLQPKKKTAAKKPAVKAKKASAPVSAS